MKKVHILGTGMIGSAIAVSLASRYQVFCIDKAGANFALLQSKGIPCESADVTSCNLSSLLAKTDLIILALPGFMAFNVLRQLIPLKKNIVDISFFPEDPFILNELATQNNITAVVDCGVAPGLGNIILGAENTQMNINAYRCYVGGLPEQRDWPFQYKAVFSPVDVIEEYTRKARIVENGQVVVKEALSEVEELNFEEIGTLEAFNTDGLRTLIDTMNIPHMVEKTMRYPGSVKYLQMLKKVGFFSDQLLKVGNVEIKPLDLTTQLLLPEWKMGPEDRDLTVMRIIIEGEKEGKISRKIYDLIDYYDVNHHITSMARTTGYTCAAVSDAILSGLEVPKGICPPEYLGSNPALYQHILNYLSDNHIKIKSTENEI